MGTYQKLLNDLEEVRNFDDLIEDLSSGNATVTLNRHVTNWERETMTRILLTNLRAQRDLHMAMIRDRYKLKELA